MSVTRRTLYTFIVKDMEDLSNWMRDLPEKSKAKPLSQLCLPGSHDSFTYSLERGSGAGKADLVDMKFKIITQDQTSLSVSEL